jgi:hypothetical protein
MSIKQRIIEAVSNVFKDEIHNAKSENMGDYAYRLECLLPSVIAFAENVKGDTQLPNSDGYAVVVKHRGVAELKHVIECLRETATYNDEEGESTNSLEELLALLTAAAAPTPDGDRLDGTWQPSSANDGMRFPEESDLIGGLEEVRGPDWIAASSKKSGLID